MALDQLSTAAWRDLLESQRWYGGRGNTLAAVDVFDAVGFEGSDVLWALVEARSTSGASSLYQLPAARQTKSGVEETVGNSALTDWLQRGFEAGTLRTKSGCVVFTNVDVSVRPDDLRTRLRGPSRVLEGEMSNTLVQVGEDLLLKVYRHLEFGVHPEVETLSFLTRAGFRHTPRQLGTVSYNFTPTNDTAGLMLLGEFLTGAVSLWDLFTAVDSAAQSAVDLGDLAQELGAMAAELHGCLTELPGEGKAHDVVGSPADFATLDMLDARLGELDDRTSPLGDEVISRRGQIEALLYSHVPADPPPIRCHGDFHLGQVVRTPAGRLVILDFEGEPALTLEDRRATSPAARDVACLLRSFSYARHFGPGRGQAWEARLRARFLDGYWRRAEGGSFVPASLEPFLGLVERFELQKAIAETRYELLHRPEWVSIPLAGIVEILGKRP